MHHCDLRCHSLELLLSLQCYTGSPSYKGSQSYKTLRLRFVGIYMMNHQNELSARLEDRLRKSPQKAEKALRVRVSIFT